MLNAVWPTGTPTRWPRPREGRSTDDHQSVQRSTLLDPGPGRTSGRGWWVLLVAGLASVVAGGIIVINDWTVGDLAVFLGALLIFRGFFTLFSFPIDGSARTSSLVIGPLEIGAGTAMWLWPGQTLLVVAFVIGWYLLFQGILAISGSIAGRRIMPYWGWIGRGM